MSSTSPTTTRYIGRFAPSPSGPLHMGSLVCALASYLDARAQNGKWLLRIEDIDPPREQVGADQLIIETLRTHGLQWDDEIVFQSQRSERYTAALNYLEQNGLSYPCTCTRKRVAALGGIYDRHCLKNTIKKDTPSAIRLNLSAGCQTLGQSEEIYFEDRVQGVSVGRLNDDFIIRRKDGLFAYQLAVVVDDIAEGITDVVRGYDLFDMTANQMLFTRLLGGHDLRYAHIPVVTGEDGCKLSKQSHASPVDNSEPANNLITALWYLQHPIPPELSCASIEEILMWAVSAWEIEKLHKIKSVTLADPDLA